MKKVITCILIILITGSLLVSCGNAISVKEAKEQTKLFINALTDGDSEKAAEYLHPEVDEKSKEGMDTFLSQLKDQGIILSGDIDEFKVYSMSTSVYSSDYKGSSCEISAKVKMGEEKYIVTSIVVNNDEGYGIFSFNIEKDN